MVSDYAPRGRAALTIGLLMTAHHAGGILSAYVALWIVEPLGWRAAFWVCVAPLLFVPVLARFLPESLSFLVARGRVEEARAPAARYDAEVPAAKDRTGGAPWANLLNLFRGGEWVQTLLYWLASFGGLLLVHGVATWLPTLMRSEGYELGSALTFVVVFLTGVFLNSAQTMIYATVSIGSAPANRATAVGRTSGMGRFGAVFGPWPGGRLLAADKGDWGFTAFALAGAASMVFIGIAALRTSRSERRNGEPQQLVTAG